jgi:hypothetical protein
VVLGLAWASCKTAIMAMNERSPWPMEQCESLVNWPQIESAHKLQAQGYGGADLLTCDTKHVCSKKKRFATLCRLHFKTFASCRHCGQRASCDCDRGIILEVI